MNYEEQLEKLVQALPDLKRIKESIDMYRKQLERLHVSYNEIMLEQKRVRAIMEELRKSNRLVTVK